MRKLLVFITIVGGLIFANINNNVYATTVNEGVAGFSRLIDNVSIEDIKEAITVYNWTTDVVNLRTEPDINSNSKLLVEKRGKVEVISTFNNWTKVRYDGEIGWIRSDYLRDTELPSLDFTDEEIDLITKIVWIESRGECDTGSAGVVIVILNRIKSYNFSDDVYSVLSDTNQFTSWKLVDTACPTEREIEIVTEVLNGEWSDLLSDDYMYFSTSPRNNNGVIKIGNHYFCKED